MNIIPFTKGLLTSLRSLSRCITGSLCAASRFCIFTSFLSSNAVFGQQAEYSSIHCQLSNREPNIKLNFSQNLSSLIGVDGKNNEQIPDRKEFLVGWNYLENHNFYHTQKPEIGGEIVVVRCLPPGRYVQMAKGTVESLNGSMIEAKVMATDYTEINLGKVTQDEIDSRNLVWRPMVGDEVFPIYKQIAKIVLALPKFKLSNNSLFSKLEDGGYSLNLSEEGKNILREKFDILKNMNGRLLIEGFILTAGTTSDLRTESLMRAQTVSDFLIREFSLLPSQVVSVGFGNDWMQTGMQSVSSTYSYNSSQSDQGVILKMLND